MSLDRMFFLLLVCSTFALDNERCFQRDSCPRSSIFHDETFLQSRNCFCDPLCEQLGDCCYQRSSLATDHSYRCTDFLSPVINSPPLSLPPLSIWMRTQCLSIYLGSFADRQCRNLLEKTFAEDPLLFIPVTSTRTNITYRNYFCAFCNNDLLDDVQVWELKIVCPLNRSHPHDQKDQPIIVSGSEQINSYTRNLSEKCLQTIIYPHISGTAEPTIFIRSCKTALPATCPSGTALDLARNCSLAATAYRYGIDSTRIYPNSYCAQCHHPNASEYTCFDPILRTVMPTMSQINVLPLSILFDPSLMKRSFRESRLSIPCSHPMFTSEMSIRFDNGSLVLLNRSIVLTKEQYIVVEDDRILFCADQWIHPAPPTFGLYRHVLSIICTVISLAGLVLFIVMFTVNPSLHNLPGQCLLFLASSIFVGQLIFALSSVLRVKSFVCILSAILIHYFYLSSFFWLLIIAIQIHSTFHRPIVNREKSNGENSRLFMSNLLVWSSSAIFILLACLMQWVNPQSNFSPEYGQIFCSISNGNGILLFFLLPIGCLLFIVVILFVRTLFAIHHSHTLGKLARVSSSSSNTSLVFVYARLAALMGLQWVLLLIALAVRQTWSWLVFEVINSLPGVFICLGFLCSHRLWRRTTTTTFLPSSSLPINPRKKLLT